MRGMVRYLAVVTSLLMVVAWVQLGWSADQKGDQKTAQKPEREIVVAFEYPRKEVEPSKTISLDLIIKNNGQKDEVVLLDIQQSPKQCTSKIEEYGDVIGGVFVAAGEKKTLKLTAEWKAPEKKGKKKKEGSESEEEESEKEFAPGKYTFVVKAVTEDKKLTKTAKAEVTVKAKEEEGEEEEEDPIEIRCSYPNLRGSNDSNFKFSIDIYNHTDKDDMASLRAEAPKGWQVAFKPSYEDKYIGSLKIDSNLSRSVDVEVTPPPDAKVGKYTIKVFAKLSKKDFEASKELTVELTGTYKIRCGTVGDLLSVTAHPGEEVVVSMYIQNRGTAPQHNISFTSFEPEKWKVKFEPKRIDTIDPGDMKQVKIKITPSADAIVGDYSVSINVNGEKAEDDLELRVTVKAPTTWAWIGVGVIIGVFVLMSVMFRVFGRR